MIDMSTWRDIWVDVVKDLELDPKNVRLEFTDGVGQGDIIQDLFANEKVLSLVDGISKVGYLTHEIPIVVRRQKKLIVVEGNRRIAALKAIQNPGIASNFEQQITKIAARIASPESLKKIRVKIAPSEDEARRLIGAIHTGSQRRAWSPNRQAAFFQAQLNAGKSPLELIEQYPTVEVRKFVLRSKLLEIFRGAAFNDPEIKAYAMARRFPVSTLERLYSNEDFLQILQIQIDENYEIRTKLPTHAFSAITEKIVGDIRSQRINTRKLNSVMGTEYQGYLNELRTALSDLGDLSEAIAEPADVVEPADVTELQEDADSGPPGPVIEGPPDTSRASEELEGGIKGQQQMATGQQPPGDTSQVTPRPAGDAQASTEDNGPSVTASHLNPDAAGSSGNNAANQTRSNRLDTSGLSVPSDFPQSIPLILDELTKINISTFPNASMDLLRTFLEKSIKAYADSQNVDIRAVKNVSGFVYLSQCLSWLEDHFRATENRAQIQVVRKLASTKAGEYYIGSIDSLNAINHNHLVHAQVEDVRYAWSVMRELMKDILAP